jgi:ubiquinone/menaquinone biosynthesis C-methylase UbiE
MPEIASAKLSIDPALLPEPGARVLDVGCGDGRHVVAVATRRCRAVGLDYDPGVVRQARERATRARARADFIVGDAARLPFRDATFAAVVCTETLEHLPRDAAALGEIARVLRDDGALHAAVPSHFTEAVYWALSPGYRSAPGGHVRYYAPGALFAMLRRAGLRVERMRYLHFVDSLFWLRYCVADRLRPRPRTSFEAAVVIAEGIERAARAPAWRRRIRERMAGSRLFAALDAAGAFIWPKSLAFVARKRP